MCPNYFLDNFVSFKCCYWFIFESFWFVCKMFQFFLMVLVIFSRNRLYVIMGGIWSDFCCVPLSGIRSILLSSWSIQDVHWLMMDGTLVLWRCFSFPWGYLNLLDLNLFAWFGWLDCKVNYLSMILGVQIL